MRLAVWTAFALVAAASAPARAETPASAPRAPQAQLVRVLDDGHKALVLDRNQGGHVLVRVGDSIQGLRVTEISPYQIVLAHADGRRHYVLPLVAPGPAATPPLDPYAGASSRRDAAATPPLDPYAGASSPRDAAATPPLDPYAGASSPRDAAATPPLDPYAGASTPRDGAAPPPLDPYGSAARPGQSADPLDPYGDASAPRDPYGEPIPSVEAPPGSRVPAAAPTPGALTVEPPVVRGAARRDAAAERRTLSRRELDAALADFDALGKEMQIRVEGRGVRLVDLSRGSLAHRLGLRAGDLVLSIAGRQVTSVDAAAAAYVALDRADSFAVVVERAGRRHTLQIALAP